MARNFENVFTLESSMYSNNCPVIVEGGMLQKDTSDDNIFAKIQMRNIEERRIVSCKVSLSAYENNGEEVEGVKDYPYLDLNAGLGDEFGASVLVPLPNKTARRFTVDITEIVFSDNTVTKITNNEWRVIPKGIKLTDQFQEDLASQYKKDVGDFAKFVPQRKEGLFLCTCGAVNKESAELCYKCGCSYNQLVEQMDINYLEGRAKETAKQKKKLKTRIMIAVAIVAMALGVVGFIINKNNDSIEADVCASLEGKRYMHTFPGVMNMYHDFEDSDRVYVWSLDDKAEISGTYYTYGVKRTGLSTYIIAIADSEEELFEDGYDYKVTKIDGTQIVEYNSDDDSQFILKGDIEDSPFN